MKKMSIWASRNMVIARLLLMVLHVYLLFAALSVNGWLTNNHLQIASQWFIVPVVAGIVLLITLTLFKQKLLVYASKFVFGKTKIATMAVCSFIFIIGLLHTGRFEKISLYNTAQGSFTETLAKKTRPQYNDYTDKKNFYKDLDSYYRNFSKKELKKELRTALKAARTESDALKAVYILLIVVGAILALFGVAVLSCGIACGGAGGLAIFVLLLGTVGLVFLSVYFIRMVLGKKEVKPVKEPIEDSKVIE